MYSMNANPKLLVLVRNKRRTNHFTYRTEQRYLAWIRRFVLHHAYSTDAGHYEAFPNAEIRVFAVIRAQGLIPNVAAIVDPAVGTITAYPSDKSMRDPLIFAHSSSS